MRALDKLIKEALCISLKRLKFVLITNSKLHTGFRLVPTSVTFNDLERRNGPYFALFHRIRQLCRPITSPWLKLRQIYNVCRISFSTFGQNQSWPTLQRGLSAIVELGLLVPLPANCMPHKMQARVGMLHQPPPPFHLFNAPLLNVV